MQLDDLYRSVSQAIREADALDDGDPAAAAAHNRVSVLEEAIAAKLPASDPEGAIARRGAVRAAFAADEMDRARDLVRRYSEDPEATEKLRQELIDLLPAPSTTVLTFDEFSAPFEEVLSQSGRICRLGGQCPALQYMGDSFARFVAKLRRQHDWVVLTSKAPSGATARHALRGLSAQTATPRPVWPGGSRVGFSSFETWEAEFSKILKRSDRRCVFSGECEALPRTGDKVRAFLDRLERDCDLVLLKSHGEPWTSQARLGKLSTVADQVAVRRASSTRLEQPATDLIRRG